jgi:hypothetical protein
MMKIYDLDHMLLATCNPPVRNFIVCELFHCQHIIVMQERRNMARKREFIFKTLFEIYLMKSFMTLTRKISQVITIVNINIRSL